MVIIYNDPKGEAYRRLIDYAASRAPMFALADRGWRDKGGSCSRVFEALEPYLIRAQSCESLFGTSSIAYTREGTIYHYRCCAAAATVLKDAASGLFAWRHPHLPEDLCFLDENGKEWLSNIAHERMAGIRIGDDEGRALSEDITGLFLKGEFNASIEATIRDAIRHEADTLHIEGYGIERIPNQIGDIRSLTTLEICEDSVTDLPDSLFRLERLEHLRIRSKHLRAIPPQIGNLRSLKRLEISCGRYSAASHGAPAADLSDKAAIEIPAEIGLLENLELLTFNHAGIRKLPPEFANLRNLKFLDIAGNRFDSIPPEVDRLPNLQHVHMGIGWVDYRTHFGMWERAFGLHANRRGEWLIRQQLNGRNETESVIELQWSPHSAEGGRRDGETGDDAETNPPGTILVGADPFSGRLRSYRIVRSEQWFADKGRSGPILTGDERKAAALRWIYAHTDFRGTFDRLQFVKESDKNGRVTLHFREVYEGVPLYPPNPVSVDMLDDGTVTGYSSYGPSALGHRFDKGPAIAAEPDVSAIRGAARPCLALVPIPDMNVPAEEGQASVRWAYGIEETFVDFRTGETIRYEFDTQRFGEPALDLPIEWSTEEERLPGDVPAAPGNETVGERVRRFIAGTESRFPYVDRNAKHPDGEPVGEENAERAMRTVRAWLMRAKPGQSGRWEMHRLERRCGMLAAFVRRRGERYLDLFGKTVLWLDAENSGFIDVFERTVAIPAAERLLPPERAFALLQDRLFCKPYYVWNRCANGYRLMHLLDCEAFVDARSGERFEAL
ncbi:leucine-rich repeat domain-containing protein [Paenibacillus sp. GYB003]|uniref:leucine-rich repeat domain-containing protein n=1 Tax=Paenibacillus sp. GYB003 TaxID=2994392 RepID=UPI002F9650DB